MRRDSDSLLASYERVDYRSGAPFARRNCPGRCPGLTNGRPVGAAARSRSNPQDLSPEGVARHQPRATSWATRTGACSWVCVATLLLLISCRPTVADDSAKSETVEPLSCGVPLGRHLDPGAVDRYQVPVAPGAVVTVNVSDASGTIGLIKLRTAAADETCSGTLTIAQAGTAVVEVSDCLGTDAGDYTITTSVVSQGQTNCGLPLPCGATLRVLSFKAVGEVDQ